MDRLINFIFTTPIQDCANALVTFKMKLISLGGVKSHRTFFLYLFVKGIVARDSGQGVFEKSRLRCRLPKLFVRCNFFANLVRLSI